MRFIDALAGATAGGERVRVEQERESRDREAGSGA